MSSPVTPLRAGIASSFIAFLTVAAVLNSQRYGWYSWYRLAMSGHTTEAVVVEKRPHSHRLCLFDYTVESVKYKASDQACRFDVGERVTVTFLPEDPSFATTASPWKHLLVSILGPLSFCILPGIGVAALLRRRRSAETS